MNSRERLLRAASFEEADRVPIELHIPPWARALPEAARLVDFVDHEADNFSWTPLVDWGFFGLDATYAEAIIDDVPGAYRRIKRTQTTSAGDFVAITRHTYEHLDSADFHWERRYIHDLEDLKRLAAAQRLPRPLDTVAYRDHEHMQVGNRGIAMAGMFHPLGLLVRNATIEEVYCWLLTEPALVRDFLETTTEQIVDTVDRVGKAGLSPWFVTYAHEMLIPPWLGMQQFREWVFPYDKSVNDAVHAIGGKCRSHCHGNSMQFLETMHEMGVDATEPLEPPPFGDVDLAEAKKRLHGRMLLSGNIASQQFSTMAPTQTRDMVKRAIDDAAAGGGFTLCPTGGHAGLADNLTDEQRQNVIANIEAYIEAGLEFGVY